jgi:DNA-binding response OmpR family regulator
MKSVLVVDDDPTTIAILEATLRGEGYRVQTAADGTAALEKVKASLPDILVTDMQMPGMTGNQLTAAVRALDRAKRVYVIMLTAHGEKPDKMKSLLSGADDFMVKPARPVEVLGRIEIAQRILRAEKEAREASRRAGPPDGKSVAALEAALGKVREQLAAAEKASMASADGRVARAALVDARAALDAASRLLGAE